MHFAFLAACQTLARVRHQNYLNIEAVKHRLMETMVQKKLTSILNDTRSISEGVGTMDRITPYEPGLFFAST